MYDGKKVEELIWTRTAVDTFLARRSEDKYRNVLKAFVIEAMTTERCAAFPSSAEIVLAFFEGKGPFSSAIVRDGAGRPYLALLTDHDRESNGAETVVAMKASEMLRNVMKDPALIGVALDPWNGGGVALPKNLLAEEMRKVAENRPSWWAGCPKTV